MSMPVPTEDSVQRRLDELLDAAAHADYATDIARIHATTYSGRDRRNLVTAVVDGDGVVTRIRFGTTASARNVELVAEAVLDAVSAARGQLAAAAAQVVARIDAQRLAIEDALADWRSLVATSAVERQAEEVLLRAGA